MKNLIKLFRNKNLKYKNEILNNLQRKLQDYSFNLITDYNSKISHYSLKTKLNTQNQQIKFNEDSIYIFDIKSLDSIKDINGIEKLINNSMLSIIFQNRNENIKNYEELLKEIGINTKFTGYLPNSQKPMSIHGKFINFKSVEPVSVLGIVSTYNDEDIIGQVLEFLISQNIDILVVDNWSNDKTESIIIDKINKYPGRIFLEKYPADKPSDKHMWGDVLEFKANNKYSQKYQWLIHYDSDEIRISPWLGKTLFESISFVDSLGFNAIEFTVVDFRPTEDGFDSTDDPQKFFRYFELGTRPGHFLQIKAWKNFGQKVDIRTHLGHDVLFEGKKIYPLKFLLKHYALRSSKYAKKKIFQDRLPRYLTHMRQAGIHRTYDKYKEENRFIWDKNKLRDYVSDEYFLRNYMCQFLFGVGIKED